MKKTVPVLALIVGIAAAGAAAYFATTGKAQFGPTLALASGVAAASACSSA
jgi:hypothetical protein